MKLYELISGVVIFVCAMSSLSLASVSMFTGDQKFAKYGITFLIPALAVVVVRLFMFSIEDWRKP